MRQFVKTCVIRAGAIDKALIFVGCRKVYNHFASKEQLFDLATTELWRTSKPAANVAFDPTQKAELQLLKICQQCLAVYQQQDFIELARVVISYGGIYSQP